VACALSESSQAVAQIPPHYSHKQLKFMESKAANADDYQKLATYFHYQAMRFSAKAQENGAAVSVRSVVMENKAELAISPARLIGALPRRRG
jgi:hypothetical protein